jgi:hypothetical protein
MAAHAARIVAGEQRRDAVAQIIDELGGLLRRGADLGGDRRLRPKADERKQRKKRREAPAGRHVNLL